MLRISGVLQNLMREGLTLRAIALDVSKGKSYVVVYENETCIKEFEIKHNQAGFNYLRQTFQNVQDQIVFEATGVYSEPLERFLKNENKHFYKMNPLLTKMQTDALRGYKTDVADAHKLAQSHDKFDRHQTIIQADVYANLRDISALYAEVQENIIKERNQLHASLQRVFPELETLYTSYLSHYTLNIIDTYTHPDIVLNQSKTKIKNQIIRSTKKHLSQIQAKVKAEELIDLAENAYPAVDQNHFSVEKARFRVKQIRDLLTMKESLSQRLIDKASALPEHNILMSIPGIGSLTAALIIAEIGDIRRFETSNKVNAYIGIDIRTYQSGTIKKRDRINKRGNARARMILFFTVRNMLKLKHRSPNHIVDYYYKMKKQPFNKRDKVAMVACMNKLLKIIHFLVIKNEMYDYTKSPRS